MVNAIGFNPRDTKTGREEQASDGTVYVTVNDHGTLRLAHPRVRGKAAVKRAKRARREARRA